MIGRAPRPTVAVFQTEVFGTWGGIQTFNRHLLEALIELAETRGWAVRVFSLRDRGRVDLSCSVRLWGAGGRRVRFAAACLLNGFLADAVVIGHVNLAPLALVARTIRPRLRYAVIAHGFEIWTLQGGLRRAGLRASSLVAAVSHDTRARLVALGVEEQRVVLLPNTVDAARFTIGARPRALAARLGLADEPVLLTVGRLTLYDRAKGVDCVLTALPAIVRRIGNIRYVVVGDGDNRPRLEAYAASLGVADRVTFVGTVAADELPDYYRLCDVFVMPSKKEGFGIVFLEALACGRPVIAADFGGARDPLLGGELGRLVPPDDPDRLADAVVDVLADRSRPREDAEVLRQRMLDHFGYKTFRGRVAELMDRMLG